MDRIATIAVAALGLSMLAIVGATWLYPLVTGATAVTITGPSMGATIPQWSLAYVEEQPRYAIGDVVTFSTTSTPVTHRIVDDWSGTGELWLTQGDGNDAADPAPIPNGAIIGRVEGHLPGLGLARNLLAEPQIIAFLFILGAGILYLSPPSRPAASQLAIAQRIRRTT